MSLNKKYTWKDFLKGHPEYREKETKRTSKEGQKAFESAYKQHIKEYLKERLVKIDKERERTEKNRKGLNSKLKEMKTKDEAKNIRQRLGAMDAYLTRLDGIQQRTKTLQKNV